MNKKRINLKTSEGRILRGVHCTCSDIDEPVPTSDEEVSQDEQRLDRSLMIMVHGFPESHMQSHNNLYERLSNICLKIGIDTLRFDFCGCGASDGKPEDFNLSEAAKNLQLIYQYARNSSYTRIMITCEGLGTIPVITTPPANLFALVLLWPVLDTIDYTRRTFQADDYIDDIRSGKLKNLPQYDAAIKLIEDLYDIDITYNLTKIAAPILILHGILDDKIPVEHLDLARAWLRNRRIEITTFHDGTHSLPQDTHRKHMFYHYEQFLEKYI